MGEYEAAIKDYTLAMQLSDDKASLYNHRYVHEKGGEHNSGRGGGMGEDAISALLSWTADVASQ